MKNLIFILLLFFATPAFAWQGLETDLSAFTKLHRVLTDKNYAEPKEPFSGDLRELATRVHDKYEHGFHYVDSEIQYGSSNYWPTRGQTLRSHKADCKGFAVAAYYDMLEAGVPDEDLHIRVVYLRRTGELHAILQAGDYIIDRMNTEVITEREGRGIYLDIYRFNRTGWQHP